MTGNLTQNHQLTHNSSVVSHSTKTDHDYSSSFMSHIAPHSRGSKIPHTTVLPSVNSSSKDTLFVFLTLAFISATLYFTFLFWRKHRDRPLATLYKLQEYRYSRLSQNELEVDSVVFYGEPIQAEPAANSDDDDECKPATLHIETDSLITVSNGKSTVTTSPKTKVPTAQNPPTRQQQNQTAQHRSPNLMIQDSDEDLLQ